MSPRLSSLFLATAILAGAASVGCAANSRPIPSDGGTDTSVPPMDADTDSARPDTGPGDGGADGGDAGDDCECPTLPACATTPANEPTFAPEGTAYADQLMSVIACANTTIDAALYQTTWPCIAQALSAKLVANPELQMRLVIDDDRCPLLPDGSRDCPLSLIAGSPRVTIVDDDRSALMHHKFMIVDGNRVWVSSGNMSRTSFCTDMNNAIVIDQAEIVAGYQASFDQMFGGDFSPQPEAPPVTGGNYTLYTSPISPASSPSPWFDDLIAAIDAAEMKVEVMISSWTRTEVSDALVRARGRGVTVRALVRSLYVDDAPALALIAAGIEVRHGNVHSKVAIIDDQIVVTGSPNWSANAWSNSEASLWIDDASIAAQYTAELDRAWPTAAMP
jgi:hypothetical protein